MVVYTKTEPLKDYFATEKLALQVFGLSLSPNLSVLYKACSYGTMSMMILYTLSILPDFFNYTENFDNFIDTAMYGTGYIVAMTKVLNLFLNRSKLNNILNTLQSGVFAPNPQRGGKIGLSWLKKCIALTTKLTIISTMVGFTSIVACVLASYSIYNSTGCQSLPFGSVSVLLENWNYTAAFFFQVFVFGTGVEAFMVVDVIYSSVLAHICVQCQILQSCIKKATKISRRIMMEEETNCFLTAYSEIPYKYLQRTLKEIVVHHMAILKVAENVEEIFNIPTLAVFTGMSACFCFIMYHGSQYSFFEPNFLKDFLILTTAMLPLILNSYWGSEVLFESQAIAAACYEVDFVGTDVKFQKALVLIMQRSQKPIKLTVGKFATLSLVTMLGVVRMSYSYFMLLRKINNPAEF